MLDDDGVFKNPNMIVKSGTGKEKRRKLYVVDKRRSFSPYHNSTRFAFKELSPNISPISNSKDKQLKPTEAIHPIKKTHMSPNVVFRTPPAPVIKKNTHLAADLNRRLSIESILIDIEMEKYIPVFQKEEVILSLR